MTQSEAVVVPARAAPKRRLPVLSVAALLEEQSTLTAVERFATRHEQGTLDGIANRYRDLVTFERPGPGEQFAFAVDLDACTGCKACVAACHSLNGLDEGESWRSVTLLAGGTAAAPFQQTVTSACHHCVDPACLNGCPVDAYEKDPITGVVSHLDDQCIGCSYCTLTCPYEVPVFNKSRGIVRKCDMCQVRLAAGEAPACVQACPNEAISIEVVDVVAFGAFTGLAVPYAMAVWLGGPVDSRVVGALGIMVAACGVVGLACSVMIYATTHRSSWRAATVWWKFALTAAGCGLGTVVW